MNVTFICHPYHRGGVTQWMAHAFNYWDRSKGKAYFVTVIPLQTFISAANRPLITTMLDRVFYSNIFSIGVDYAFELGNIQFRASVYKRIILKNIPEGVPIIPSDDEACWLAAASLAERNPFFPIVHSVGDNAYYTMLERYYLSIRGIIAVSKRAANRIIKVLPQFPLDRLLVNPCGLPIKQLAHNGRSKSNNVVWIGRMDEKSKRISDLPKIIRKATSLKRSINFMIIGDGEMFAVLEKFVSSFRDELITISLMGWLEKDRIYELLSSSKVLILTSNYEGMPITVMEALSLGCSVVSTRVSGVEDIEVTEQTSKILYQYDVGDVSQAVILIEKSLNNHTDGISDLANNFAMEYFSIEKRNESMRFFIQNTLKTEVEIKKRTLSWWGLKISSAIALVRIIKWKIVKVRML